MKHISVKGLNRLCSQIALGTSFFRPEIKELVFEILDAYIGHGGNVLDTSRIYGSGKSEQVIAEWLKARQNRKELVIISKGCHHYVDREGRHYPEQKRVSPKFITQDLMESLNRMNTGYFDIYLIHRDDQDVSVEQLVDSLEGHKNAGLIKSYGVSNWSAARIDQANRYAASKGYAGFAVNSPSFSLAKANESRWQGCVYADDDYINWHKKNKMPLFPWASQASGFFAGKIAEKNNPNPDIVRVYYNETNRERFKRASQLAKQKGENYTANHIALAYVLNQPFPVCAIIGPQKPNQLIDSFKAADIEITKQERLWLELKNPRVDFSSSK